MARWDNEDLSWEIDNSPNAPCHTCVYRDRGDIGNMKGAGKASCDKYPIPRYSLGIYGKPNGILEGKTPCAYYKKETP